MKSNLTIDNETMEVKGLTNLEKSLLKDYIAQNFLYKGLNNISCDTTQTISEMAWKANNVYKDGNDYHIEGYVFYENDGFYEETAWFHIAFNENDGIISAGATTNI